MNFPTISSADLTAIIGMAGAIVGAVVGGGIGLLGQRMSLREQRRKELRERTVDLLRDATAIVLMFESIGEKFPEEEDKQEEFYLEWMGQLNQWMLTWEASTLHLQLLMPPSLYRRVAALEEAFEGVMETFGDDPTDKASFYNEAKFKVATDQLNDRRWELIRHFQQKI